MLQRKYPVVFAAAMLDACALWRFYYPHWNMPGSSFYCFADMPKYELLTGHDVLVVQRAALKSHLQFMHICQQLGMKIIYDLDDNLWELPDYNPAQQLFNSLREGFTTCARYSTVITVSTKHLAKAVRKHVRNLTHLTTGREIPIVVADNRMDIRHYVPAQKRPELVVGWAGSSSHIGDLELVVDALKVNAGEMPTALFEFRGCEPPPDLWKLGNFRHKVWTAVAEFGCRMPLWGWSIALAPLQDEPFNNSKSCIKMMEAAACGIPCLASWVEPYDAFTSHDKDLRWLLCAGKSAWETKLRTLMNDEAMRNELGEKARAVVLKHYAWNRPHAGWEEALQLVRTL